MIKRLKEMLLDFLMITAGTTLSATVFCTIFSQDFTFGIELLWQIVALSFFCTLPIIIFHSKKELTKTQMLIRQIVHLCVLLTVLIFFAYYWEWIDTGSIVQPIVFVALVAVVYITVTYFAYQCDKKVAILLNDRLERYKKRNSE